MQVGQGRYGPHHEASSSNPPEKCRRGRQRKNPTTPTPEANEAPTPLYNRVVIPPVGTVVNAVVLATFEDGCLLSASYGDTILRGVFLRPGDSTPVGPENDVAPNLPMIRRQDIPVPAGNAPRPPVVPASASAAPPRPTPPARRASGASRDAWPEDPLFARGNWVPVVLQPRYPEVRSLRVVMPSQDQTSASSLHPQEDGTYNI